MNSQAQKLKYLHQLESIKKLKCSQKMRVKLLEGLVEKLRLIDNNPQLLSVSLEVKKCPIQSYDTHKSLFSKKNPSSQYQSTSHSFFSDQESFVDYPASSSQEYEQKIMQKRVIKFEINEEIQALEDDLFQIEKVTQTKRSLNDQLAKHIQKRMKQIGEKSNDKKTKQEGFGFTSFSGTFRSKKKQQGCSFDMNATISGASGFGLPYYKSKDVSENISTMRNDTRSSYMNEDGSQSPQRKKAKSHYLGKGFSGILKNILK